MDIPPVGDGEEATLYEIHRAVFYSLIEQIWGWYEDWQKANFAKELESTTTSVVSINGLIIGYVQICDEGRNIKIKLAAPLIALRFRCQYSFRSYTNDPYLDCFPSKSLSKKKAAL